MNKPYVETEESASGLHVSMVTDCSIPDDELNIGCNNCFNGMSDADVLATEGDLLWEWQDLGDGGCFCPACADTPGAIAPAERGTA